MHPNENGTMVEMSKSTNGKMQIILT